MTDTRTPAVKAQPAPAPERSKAELHADIEKTRAELRSTLDAIEFKLNVPKQTRHAVHRLKSSVNRFREANPTAFAAAAAGAVVTLGAVAVLGFRFASKK